MATRREFIQMSVAASALTFAGVQKPGSKENVEASPGHPPTRSLYCFLVDDRFPESVDAGKMAVERGVKVQTMRGGDVTSFWYEDLSLRWKKAPVAIAGLSAHGPLFVLERLAWDHRMRVVELSEVPGSREHGDGEPLFSWVIAPAPPQA